MIIKARLAKECVAVIDYKERDRATEGALEVAELVAMKITHFFTVAQFDF